MKRNFLFLLFVFFCFLAAAGQQAEYMMTESELTELETLLGKWESIKQMQSSQIRNLEAELNEALKYQESLTEQLTQARIFLRKSEKSLEEYEKESMEKIAEKQKEIEGKKEEIAGLKIKNYRLKLTLTIISSIMALLILSSIGLFILKMKLKFL
ncbi:hypothetical protein [Treponema pedis]|uniref:hypothetical protein n=1 Tax=Treponema pedis TaxID=409322 RepID=UPI0004646EEB|nr:hypothetical protein [Treponema pedis]